MNRLTQDNITNSNYLDNQIESSKTKKNKVFDKIEISESKLNELGGKLEELRNSKLSIKNLWKRASTHVSIWKEQANLNNLYVTQTKYHCTALLFQSIKDQIKADNSPSNINAILADANATLKKIHNLKNKDLWKVEHAFKHTYKEEVEHLRSEIEGNESANGSSDVTNEAPETNIQTDKEGILPDNIDARNRTGNPQNTSPEETTAFTTSTLGDSENSASQPDNEIQDEASKGVNSEENLGDVLPKEAHPEGDEPGQINGPTDEPVPDGVTPKSVEGLVVDNEGKLKNSGATGHQEEPATSEEIPAKSHDDTLISSEKEPDASEKKPNFDADSTEHSLEASTHIGDKTPEIDKSKETNKGSGIMGTNPEIEAKTKELKNAVQGCVIAVGDMVNKAGSGTTASAFIKSGMIVIDGITKQTARLIQKTYEGEDSEATIKPKHDSDKSVNTETKSEKTPGTEEISKTETTKNKKRVRKNAELNSQKGIEIFANYKMSSYIDEHSEELAADPVLYNGAKKIVKFIPTENQKEELSKPANSPEERARNAMNACKNGEPVYFEEAEGKPISEMHDDELNEIPAMDRLIFIKDILCQVAFLNKVGIIHRDFNPGNVIINAQNGKKEARLIDFGGAVCQSDLDVYPKNFKNATTQFTPPEGIEGPNFDKYNDYGTGILILEMIYGNEWHKEIPEGLTNAIAYTMQRGNQNPGLARQKLEQALEKTINEWINNKDSTFSEKCKEIGFTPEQTEFVRTLLTGLLQPDSEKRMSALDAARNTDKFINSQTDGNPTNSGVDTKGSKTPEKPASPAAEKTLGSIADSSAPKDEGKTETKETTTSTPTHTDATPAPTKAISAAKVDASKSKADIEAQKDKFVEDAVTALQGNGIGPNDIEVFKEILGEIRKDNTEMSPTDFQKEVNREIKYLYLRNNKPSEAKKINASIDSIVVDRTERYNSGPKNQSAAAKKDSPSTEAATETKKTEASDKADAAAKIDMPTSGTDVTKTTTAPTVSATTTSKPEMRDVMNAIAAKGTELIQTAEQLGKGTFGTVFAASVEVLGKTLNIVAKTMNSAKKIADGEATSSENLNNLQTVLDYLSKEGGINFNEGTMPVSEGLTQYIAVLSQYEKAYQGESIATRINQLKTKLTELKDKALDIEQGKSDIKNLQSEFATMAKDIKPFTPEELNTLNDADALLDLYQEIYVNAKINMEIIRESEKTGQTPLEYAEAHHIPLCLSAMPDDGKVIPDEQLIDFARRKAHEVLKSDNRAIISTQIPGENLTNCFKRKLATESSKFDKLSMKARVKVVQDFFTATKLLNAAGIYHNDLHSGNMQVNVVDENNAEGYILDFGRAVEVNGKNYDFFEYNFIGLRDWRFSPPEMFTKEADTNKITSPEGLDKCAVYGLGTNLFSLLGGDEGLKVQNRYFPRTGIKPNSKEPQAVWNFLCNKIKSIKENIEEEIDSKNEKELITLFSKEKIEKLKAKAKETYRDDPTEENILYGIKEELKKEQVIAQVLASDVLSPEEKEMYAFFTGQETKDQGGTEGEIVKLSQKLYFKDIGENVKKVFREQSPETQNKIIALMKGTTEIDPEKRMTLTQAQESLDELKLLIDPEQNRTEQNVNNRSTESKEISTGKPADSSEVSPASLSPSEEQPVDDVTAIIGPTTVDDTEFQSLARPITKDCYTITKIATESVGAGSFGTVFKVMANVAGNIAGKAQEVQAALKRMNGNTNKLSQISSYFKYAIDQLNDPSVSDKQKGEYLAGVKQNIEYLLKNYNKDSIQKQLQGFNGTLQKLPQRDPRIQKFKSDTANLLNKNVPQNLENLAKNLLSKLNDTTSREISERTSDIEKITNVLDSVNLKGEFEKLKDASREIFNNAYMYVGMLEKAKEENLSPLEYAAKHNITLCFSAIPSDEKLSELNSITDENQKKKMLLKWSYETAQKILENPDDGLLFSLVPGKSMASIGYDEINKLSHQGGLGILDGFFQTMEELDKLGLIHNDAHEGNVNVDIKDENNAKGYVFDHGISVLTSDPNQFNDVSAHTHRPIISPNIRNGKPNGPKDNSYAIGMKIPQIYLGIEGQKLYNQYFVNFEKLAEFGLVDDSFIQQIKQDKCNVWEINERLQKAGANLDEIYNLLQESFYQELKNKIREGISSKKGAFGHDAKACKILDKLLETLNPDSDKRITSTEARALIKELKKYENSKIA